MVVSRASSRDQRQRELNGVEKVTALLLAMAKPNADRIIRQLENIHIRALTRSAMKLPEVPLEHIDSLARELAAEIEKGSPLVGSTEGVKELLAGVVAEETISELMDEIAGEPPRAIWPRLVTVPAEKLASFIASEQPQVAAYILSNLPAEKASEIITLVPAGLQAEVSARLLSLKPISKQAARMVADRLATDLLIEPKASGEVSGHARLGAILNNLERDRISGILEEIEVRSPDDARRVRKFIFSFEDLASLSPEDRSRLLDEVPPERTVLALRDCEPSLTELVLSSLSPRSRRIAEAELVGGASPSRKTIMEARRSIAAQALSLAEKSVIRLGAESAEEASS